MPNEHTPILIVDDEEIVLLAISESLMPEGYSIVKTTDPNEGLEYLKKQEFAVIISDHHMPSMTGLEFFAEANKIQPMASRILITGVLTLKVVVDAINKGEIFRFIAKPWIREELLATVKNATNRYELMAQNSRLQQETQSTNAELIDRNRELETELKDLKARQNYAEDSFRYSNTNLTTALEIIPRILHSYDPALGREANLIVNVCKSMIADGRIKKEDAKVLTVASYLVTLGKLGIDKKQLQNFIKNPHSIKSDDLEYFHNIPIYAQLHASLFEGITGLSETVRACHERVDGSGYPDGLTNRDIPQAAKFLAVAVYYAESDLSTHVTLDQIREKSGSTFDQEAVAVFLNSNITQTFNKKTTEVKLDQLTPGMVIAEDLRNHMGAILLPQSSSLSNKTINLIRQNYSIEHGKSSFLIFS